MKKFKYTLDSDFKGVPFDEIFLIRKFGLEYELELAIFHESKPIPCDIHILNFNSSLAKISVRYSLQKNLEAGWFIILGYRADGHGGLVLFLDPKILFPLLQKKQNYTGYKSWSITDNHTLNFELRTNCFPEISQCVEEANRNLQILASTLCSMGLPRFLLLLPALRAYDDNEPYCTKHLNISLNVRGSKKNKTLEMRYSFLLRWFADNYPFYFSRSPVPLDLTDKNTYISLMNGVCYKDKGRAHLKIPYNVKDYESFLQGTLELPRIWEYQEDFEPKPKTPAIQLLGYSSLDKWIKTSDLV